MIHEIQLHTKRRDEMLDRTAQVEKILISGKCSSRTDRNVFTPYYRCSLTVTNA